MLIANPYPLRKRSLSMHHVFISVELKTGGTENNLRLLVSC